MPLVTSHKIFIALSASFGMLSIASHATVVGIPVAFAGASVTLIFMISTGVNKSLLQVTKKRKKHIKIIALAKSKLNTIDTLLSSSLNDYKISHEEFTNLITEKNMYENIKENIEDTAEPSALARNSLEHIKDRTHNIIKII